MAVKNLTLVMTKQEFDFNRELCEQLNNGPIYVGSLRPSDTVTIKLDVTYDSLDKRLVALVELLERGFNKRR